MVINPNEVQRLELVDRLFNDIFSGKKRNTKRYQDKEITEGFLLYEASEDDKLKALVWVTGVDRMKLSHVAEKVEDERHTSLNDLLHRMQSHYPKITLETEVDVVMHLTPLETYVKYGIPDFLLKELGAHYFEKIGV